ncbi:MAG: Ornithine utilization regulator, partial [Pseudomonadota bacterium]
MLEHTRAVSAGTSITSIAAWALSAAVARSGQPIEALFQRAGLDPSAPPDAERHLPAELYYELWEQALELVPEAGFAVQVGAAFDLEALEAFGFLAMSCETLRHAYERTARVRGLYNVGSRWELEVEGDR